MANGHGGKRAGAGRPRKPLAEKIMEGYPGKRKPKVLDFADAPTDAPEYPERLAYYRSVMAGEPSAQDVWNETVEFLKGTGCLHLINPAFIEEYAILKARFYEAERILSRSPMVYAEKKGKDKGESWAENPAVDASIKYLRAADLVWDKIWEIVLQNSEKAYGENPNADIMNRLLAYNWE